MRVIKAVDGYRYVDKIQCNSCRNEVWTSKEYSKKSYFELVVRESRKPGEKDLHLCARCYDAFIDALVLPADKFSELAHE